MRFASLRLSNFRCFAQYELRLAPQLTLLIGNNGAGKTALLDALSIAAGSFLLGVQGQRSRPIGRDDIRRVDFTVGQTPTREFSGPVVVAATGLVNGSESIDWSRELASENSRTTRKSAASIQSAARGLAERVRKGDRSVTLPVIAYYGTGRLWRRLRASEKKIRTPESRLKGYADCLNPASDQKAFFRWFKTNELAALQKSEKRHVLEAVRESVIAMIPDSLRVYWDIDWDELRVNYNAAGKERSVPFAHLSDGYRNMAGMIADIAYRMATLNPHLQSGAIRETPGIVLIDEIDLHLHPNWQREVLGRLTSTFPKVQFVATTHSPFIIQSLHDASGAALWDIAKAGPVAVETKSIEDIAETKQGVDVPQQSKRYLEMMNAAEEYYKVLEQAQDASGEDAKRARKRLDELAMPFSDDPAFQALLKLERVASPFGSKKS